MSKRQVRAGISHRDSPSEHCVKLSINDSVTLHLTIEQAKDVLRHCDEGGYDQGWQMDMKRNNYCLTDSPTRVHICAAGDAALSFMREGNELIYFRTNLAFAISQAELNQQRDAFNATGH